MMDILETLLRIGHALINGQLPEWGSWSYLVLAVLVAFEGPIVTLLGAAAASAGIMRPIPVFFAASLGNLTSDTVWYTLGYLGKVEWLLHFGRRLGVSREYLDRLERGLHEHASKILFFAKLSVGPMIPTLIATGLIKVPWRRWFPSVFGAEMIWTGTLVLIGYHATQAIQRVERGVEFIIAGASIVFVVFLIWLGRRIWKQNIKDSAAEVTPDNKH
jgi:membrane protein DedA with SNARE-associated domain